MRVLMSLHARRLFEWRRNEECGRPAMMLAECLSLHLYRIVAYLLFLLWLSLPNSRWVVRSPLTWLGAAVVVGQVEAVAVGQEAVEAVTTDGWVLV